MANNPSVQFPGRITAPDAAYPYGSSKDETAPAAGDGTPYVASRANDIFGLQQALLRSSGMVPTNSADTAIASQYLQAIIEQAAGRAIEYDGGGSANAYVFTLKSNQQGVGSLFEGMRARGSITANNTGAATLNVGGTGVKNIKTAAGSDPAAGDFVSGQSSEFVYNGVNWIIVDSVQSDNYGLAGNYDIILPVGVYTSGTYSIPNGRTWDDYDIIEVNSTPGTNVDLIGGITSRLPKEAIAGFPTTWSTKSASSGTNFTLVTATSSTQFTVTRNGTDSVKYIIGYRKAGAA